MAFRRVVTPRRAALVGIAIGVSGFARWVGNRAQGAVPLQPAAEVRLSAPTVAQPARPVTPARPPAPAPARAPVAAARNLSQTNPGIHQIWSKTVFGEVEGAPEMVKRMVARTALARQQMPGWRGQTLKQILTPSVYQARSSPKLQKRITRNPAEFTQVNRIIDEEYAKGAQPADGTHFYTESYLKDETLAPGQKKPYWATGDNLTGSYSWTGNVWNPKTKKYERGTYKIYFHRLER